MDKRWPQQELDGLFAAEDAARQKVILPVWHDVDKKALVGYSPILAGRLAANTADGIPSVARQIIDVVTEPGSGGPSDIAPTPLRLLVALLDRGPTRREVVDFLALYPKIVHVTLGTEVMSDHWSTAIGGSVVDLAASRTQQSTGEVEWRLIQFLAPVEPLSDGENPSEALVERVEELRAIRAWIGRNLIAARATFTGIAPTFIGVVIAGRRLRLSEEEVEWLRRYNEEVPGITIRTYDWIIDAAAETMRSTL